MLLVAVTAIAAAIVLNRDGAEPAGLAAATTASTATAPTSLPATTTSAPTTVPPATTLAPGTTVCDRYGTVSAVGRVETAGLVETSGIAASRAMPGLIWAHNDSGADPVIYAIGPGGEDLGSLTVAGGLAFDWEDMAVGPGPDPEHAYLYIGDIGDNFAIRRGRVTVYRAPEPDPAAATVHVDAAIVLDSPDGPHDFESLFVSDGSIYLVTKEDGPAKVYRGATDGDPALELVATLDLGAAVTGADVSWDGTTIAFRGYETVWLWHRPPGSSVTDALLTEPCLAPVPDELQGEAVTFLEDGSLATLSEGSNAVLHVIS